MRTVHTLVSPRAAGRWVTLLALCALLPACKDENQFARVARIESMAETIGGPAAAARPGDLLLENDRIRAVVHARHNQRSTFPIGNGSLVDLDLQRPQSKYGNGRGKDAFYELGPMVNLKINSSVDIRQGTCGAVGASPCPQKLGSAAGTLNTACQRISAAGSGDTIFGILSLLDLAIKRNYPSNDLQIVTDYDLCPGEAFVRLTTTARYFGATGVVKEMDELPQRTGLLDVLLGVTSGIDCAQQMCPAQAPHCDDLLVNLSLGSFKTEMKRCRTEQDGLSGVLAGDFAFFSAKARVFVPGNGFDQETFSRSVFDTGGDIFSNPMALEFIAATSDDVSYAYFNEKGRLMVPIFSDAFTLAMTNRVQCPRDNPTCIVGNELRFRRYVSVGRGDIGSALEGFYQVRGVQTGRVEGNVIDMRSRKPVSRIDVFVFSIPAAWQADGDAALSARDYPALVSAHRTGTQGPDNPLGEAGLVSHFRTDPTFDTVPDGSFGGPLPPGRYLLVTRDAERPPSALVPVHVTAGQTTRAVVAAAEGGVLDFEIRDDAGRLIPSKLTIGHCFAECARDQDCSGSTPFCDTETRICTPTNKGLKVGPCRPDQLTDGDGCRCPDTGRLPLELGGKRFADNTVRTVLTGSGRGRLVMEPGVYQVIASRGMEYDISRQYVTLFPNSQHRFSATLSKVVDTKGWVSADFHVHGPNSVDSGLDHETRVLSYAAEGVQLISSSDHDQLTNYKPTIYDLKLQPWVNSQVGVEISPLDYGHFIGFPLMFDERLEQRGGFHWRVDATGQSPDWTLMPPGQIFGHMRERGSLGVEDTVTFIAHFYDHFEFFSVDPWTLEAPSFGLSSIFNPVVVGTNFSGAFDALEVLNGKNLDNIRRPTRKEVTDYNTGLNALLAVTGITFEERLKRWAKLSSDMQREYLRRTPDEQALAINYNNPNFECRCTADEECGPGAICDRATGGCINRCVGDVSCAADKVTVAREACLATDGVAARKTCQRTAPSCTDDSQCTFRWGSSGERCLVTGASGQKTCELACTGDDFCKRADAMRPVCNITAGRCISVPVVGDLEPCTKLRGTMDDWFQMLNRGVRRTLLANSDSHSIYDNEAGLPRTYVQSTAETPSAIKELDIARAVKAGQTMGTFGPFVEFRINGQGPGSTVPVRAGDQVVLSVRVQSPKWFDVDRLEIYRNGELWKVVEGRLDCARGSNDCIKVPNDTIVNFDGHFVDRPDRDAWYVVVAMGLDGKAMGPVYSSTPVARLGTFELIQRLTPLLPPLRSLRIPFSPTITLVRPYAATSPIYVDIGGDGLTPVASLPTWATPKDVAAAMPQALTVAPGDPNAHAASAQPGASQPGAAQANAMGSTNDRVLPVHDHSRGLGRMTAEARDFLKLGAQGKLPNDLLQRAYEMLRQHHR